MIVYGMCECTCEGPQHRNLDGDNLWTDAGENMKDIGEVSGMCESRYEWTQHRGLGEGALWTSEDKRMEEHDEAALIRAQ